MESSKIPLPVVAEKVKRIENLENKDQRKNENVKETKKEETSMSEFMATISMNIATLVNSLNQLDKKFDNKIDEIKEQMDPAKITEIANKVDDIEKTVEVNSRNIQSNTESMELVMSRLARLEREQEISIRKETNPPARNIPPAQNETSFRDIMQQQRIETGTRPKERNTLPANRNSESTRPNERNIQTRVKESVERANKNLVNTCPIDVMSEAKRKVGLDPVTEQMIREWIEDSDSRENDTPDKIFKGSSNHIARVNAAVTFIEDKLRIPVTEIMIKDVKMCRDPRKEILWIESDERFVRRVFYKASIIKDESIRIVQYTPHETFIEKWL